MEESMISTNYMSKAQTSSDEESSWDFYIDHYESEDDSLLLSGCQSGSSLDSADPALKNHLQVPSRGICGRFNAKRRKFIVSCVDNDDDDELKDTASSPDNSPKVIDFNQFYMNSKEMIHPKGFFQEHNFLQKLNNQQNDGVCSGASDQGEGETSNEETEGIGFAGKESYYNRELRRQGLCLAPISILFKCVS